MTQQDDGVRDIGAPFRMFSPGDPAAVFDVDFHPQVVRSDELHPSEVDVDPKATDSSAQESVESFSDLIPEPEVSATAEKASTATPTTDKSSEELSEAPPEGNLDSPAETSPGDVVPPAPTPPQPPAPTRSSRSAGKSS